MMSGETKKDQESAVCGSLDASAVHRRRRIGTSLVVIAAICGLNSASTNAADEKSYIVNYVATAPIIDGMLTTADEWGAATSGIADWSLLKFDSPDPTSNRFEAVWNDNGIFVKHEVDYAGWRDAGRQWDPTYEAISFYFDPNVDGETNADSAQFPFSSIDGYQLSINQPLGNSVIDSSASTAGAEAHAYVDAIFGDLPGEFSGFVNAIVSQTTSVDANSGYFEMFIPWSDFDAAPPNSEVSDSGLFHPEAPVDGEQWFFNLARTQSDFVIPAWNSPAGADFASQRPHGILEFSGPGNPCDIDGSGVCDAIDIDTLAQAILEGNTNGRFDLTQDGAVTDEDRVYYVEVTLNSYLGDSNLDGVFGTRDFVAVFGVGGYEDGIPGNATWASGDWNGDFDFDSRDFVAAFISGGFEMGPRVGVAAVPEPTSRALLMLGLIVCCRRRNNR